MTKLFTIQPPPLPGMLRCRAVAPSSHGAGKIIRQAFHDYTESFDAPKQFIQPGSQRSAMPRIGQDG